MIISKLNIIEKLYKYIHIKNICNTNSFYR